VCSQLRQRASVLGCERVRYVCVHVFVYLERNAWNTLGRVRREEGGGRRDGRDSLE